ncbi:IclR family transcriptional regulator [Solicola gregarius]|uniref:IclR family transcriptional regulator n=1 Tax=Solicola gregarius TaxID=2908642 RepID=A0AA46TNA8_9ACTN|nr:IclR family transcriptional regulator [Solicola gregarius]UYM07508.1 IclR family transcriptional regulator [Solicola gregarius]
MSAASHADPDHVPRSGRVQSVDRAVALLRAVAAANDDRANVAALAADCGLNRATAWRILSTLEAQEMVVLDRPTGRYAIGFGVVELAGAAGVGVLVQSAHSVLERVSLLTGETAALAVVRDNGLTYVDEVAPTAVVSATWRGRTVSLHATSTGKALLAYSSDDLVHRILREPLTRHTDTTITDPDALLAELATARDRGYGVCRGEFEESAYGVSAPVLDSGGRPLAVLSIWGPGGRLTEARFEALGEIARDAAIEIGSPGRRG